MWQFVRLFWQKYRVIYRWVQNNSSFQFVLQVLLHQWQGQLLQELGKDAAKTFRTKHHVQYLAVPIDMENGMVLKQLFM